ncbi:MAG TPA: hypothetical protein VG452_11325 [Egibacteraceae bacterium]|nr:hypothetical protein [Actinomycetota bacterium]HWB72798.1 hypothetical protein [Egibacteraceae bacterium]
MASQSDPVDSGQEQVIEMVRRSQDAVLTAIRTWSDSVVRLVPDFSSVPVSEQYFKPREAVDTAFAFAEQLLSTQRQFLHDVLSAIMPVVEAAGERPTPDTKTTSSAKT